LSNLRLESVAIGRSMEKRGAIGSTMRAKTCLRLYGAAKSRHRNRLTLSRMWGAILARAFARIPCRRGLRGARAKTLSTRTCWSGLSDEAAPPIKWIEDRRVNLDGDKPFTPATYRAASPWTADGRLLVLDDVFFHDQGAYIRTHGSRRAHDVGVPLGPYRVPKLSRRRAFRPDQQDAGGDPARGCI